MSDSLPKRLVIVGGGTAGWMAASYLNRFLVRKGWGITLVELPDGGTSAVGEAATPSLVRFVRTMGFDEDAFMRRCAATYRLGTRFLDWREPGHDTFHPFGLCGVVNGLDLFHFWARRRLEGGGREAYTDHSLQALLAAEGRAPRQLGGSSPVMHTGAYGFHLDASALAEFLREVATAEGVRHLFGEVREVRRDTWGDIASLDIGGGRQLAGDLFLDATGPRALLAEGALEDPWIDGAPHLPCDAAVVMPLPRDPDPPPATRVTALDAGWMWQVPLATRTGAGYVYSSAHATPDEAARALLERADLKRARTADPRHLPLRAGRRRNAWLRNCVALGPAAGAVEPLEGTDLHLVQRAVELLVDHFPAGDRDDLLRAAYNARVVALHEEVRDAVLLRYLLSQRTGPLWRAVRAAAIPDALRDALDLYESNGVLPPAHGDAFPEAHRHFLLAGHDRLPRRPAPRADFTPSAPLEGVFAEIRAQNRAVADGLPRHGALIEALHRPTPLRPRTAEGRRLLEAVAALGRPFRSERSVRLVPGAVLADRFLLSLDKADLGPEPAAALRALAAAIGLPADLAAPAAAALAEADAIHLGHETGTGGSVRKLYLEFADAARAAAARGEAGVLAHRAYKWDPARPEAHEVARYHVRPGLSAAQLRDGIAALAPDGPARAVGLALLDAALARCAAADLMLLAVDEPANGRLSYDLNLYGADLGVGATAALVAPAAAAFGVAEAMAGHLAGIADDRLGHVSGGIGRDGRPFLTLYHGGRLEPGR